ncbi:MAG: DNA replication/repair protein RecF [Patescibacteria group bacterium]
MFLKSIKLTNFRNFENFSHNFEKNLTILFGKNAAGKTNFLEAARFLSFSKSFRADHDLDLIFWGKDFTKIQAQVKTREENQELDLILSKKQRGIEKIIKINNANQPVSFLIGKFISVLFSPEDMLLISGSPALRRRYLDIILGQIDHHYYHFLLELKKVLASRNKLLLEIKEHRADIKELSFWDEKLVQCGAFIIKKRKELLDFINSKIAIVYQTIAGNSGDSHQKVTVTYTPNIEFEEIAEIENNFQKELSIKKEEEIQKCRTLCGPHRDDFIFYLNRRKLSCFGSRGEFRSAILALKILELDFLESRLSERPVLLLDDIFSELDSTRRVHLLSLVQKQQTIITTTELNFISKEFVNKGEVVEIRNSEL